ncbi:M24 family metallopeptidase [Halomicrococcus sp. NG-SE-24]|uniref:M24 family metallopeptidase n=1 Tax=Halomicrococcus sp. NG-SE-24 TaxID=3436928 RepID=UPI003D9845A0
MSDDRRRSFRADASGASDSDAAFERVRSAVETRLDARAADAFVHVGDRFDDLLRHLTRFSGPDRDYAVVYADGRAVLCAPRLFAEQARREFPGDVRTAAGQDGTTAAERATETLQEFDGVERLLVPGSAPYDAVSTLAETFAVATTDADFGRARKTEAERDRIAAVQAAARRGMARAEAVLADATPGTEEVFRDGEPLTTERLRREVNAVLAGSGVRSAGNTVVGAGPTCADLHFTGDAEIRPGETVLLDLSPRGPAGYYGDCTRTFVVGPLGEWEQAAYDAVCDAQDAAFAVLDGGAGTRASAVHERATDVLGDHGFDSGAVEVGMYHGTGHGVGRSLHEAPSLSSDAELEAGNVVTVEPGVYDPDRGGVRIEDLVVVTESGYENLTDYPRCWRPSSDLERRETGRGPDVTTQ